MTTPVNTLISNWAYMVMTSLAWSLKAWFALWPQPTGTATEQSAQRTELSRVLRMEFKTFMNNLMRLPATVVHSGRRNIVRFISWTPLQPLLFQLLASFRLQRH